MTKLLVWQQWVFLAQSCQDAQNGGAISKKVK
jgi:hypothetical protein